MLEMIIKSERTNVLWENKINKFNSKTNLNQNEVNQDRNAIDKFWSSNQLRDQRQETQLKIKLKQKEMKAKNHHEY